LTLCLIYFSYYAAVLRHTSLLKLMEVVAMMEAKSSNKGMEKIIIIKTVPYKHQKPVEISCLLGKKIKADIVVKIGGKSPKNDDIRIIETTKTEQKEKQ